MWGGGRGSKEVREQELEECMGALRGRQKNIPASWLVSTIQLRLQHTENTAGRGANSSSSRGVSRGRPFWRRREKKQEGARDLPIRRRLLKDEARRRTPG